jgi:integrase
MFLVYLVWQAPIYQLLREHRVRQPLQRAVAGNRWQEHDLIFTTSIGNPCDPSNLRKDFLKVLEAAGLPKMRFHDLRHTSASLMLNHSIPVIIASKRLGHATPSITMDTYGHLFNDMQGDVAKLMDELVTPIRVDMAEIEQEDHITRD